MIEPTSQHSTPWTPMQAVLFCYQPTDAEIESDRQRREDEDRKHAADPPRNCLPSTPAALLAECKSHRARIVEAMRQGQRFHPSTDANLAALLKGDVRGFLLPSFERLWHSAVALDVPNLPAFYGEPQAAMQAIAALDSLLGALAAVMGSERPAIEAKRQPNRRGGRRPLETSNPLKASVYAFIRNERRPGERYTDLANRLKHDKDFVDMAKSAGVTKINYTLVRNAIEHASQRERAARKKARN